MEESKDLEKTMEKLKGPGTMYKVNDDGTAEIYYSLATGSVIPYSRTGMPTSLATQTFQSIPDDFHKLVPILRKYYETDGLFGTVVDILIQFTTDNTINNVTDNAEVQKFFDGIVETSNIRQAIRWASMEYHLCSNAFPYRGGAKEKVVSRSGMEVPLYEWTVLNPDFTEVSGSLLFNEARISIVPSDELIELADKLNKSGISEFMPSKFLKMIKAGDNIVLDKDNVYHIARNKQPFQRYAPVSLKRVLRPLQVKEKYMQMDLSTANGIINQMVVFKLGSDKFPVVDESRLRKFEELLRTPSHAYQLVWTHDLEIEVIRSDPNVLSSEKYDAINKELLYGFATPSALVGGDVNSYGRDYIAVKGLVERLKWARQDIEAWLEREYRIIAEENNLPTWPKPKLGAVSLEEDQAFRNILMSLYDHGVLSAQTVLSESGYELLTEVERLKIEKEIREEHGVLIPSSPYQQSKNDESPIGVKPEKSDGRPLGKKDSEPRDKRTPTPAPTGAKANLALGEKEYDKAAEELYLASLTHLYKKTKKEVLKAMSSEGDRKKQAVLIGALMSEFRESMKEIGVSHLTLVYDKQSEEYLSTEKSSAHDEWLDKLLDWNNGFVDKLYNDLWGQIQDSLKRDTSEIPYFLDVIFEKEVYRLDHFAREGVKKAKVAGDISVHTHLGYTHGKWVTSFRNSCEVCIDRHESIFPIAEIFDMYPAHVRCECIIEYFIAEEE